MLVKKQGLTQAEIGEKVGWSRDSVKNYIRIIDGIGTHSLESAKGCQVGRVPINGTVVPSYDFTEGWFRNSGLYELHPQFCN